MLVILKAREYFLSQPFFLFLVSLYWHLIDQLLLWALWLDMVLFWLWLWCRCVSSAPNDSSIHF